MPCTDYTVFLSHMMVTKLKSYTVKYSSRDWADRYDSLHVTVQCVDKKSAQSSH